MKTKKRKKFSRMHGRNMGTAGHGARKKSKGKGHRGGKGLSGSGKRADHKKTLITKKYGHGYFGKKGKTLEKKSVLDNSLEIQKENIIQEIVKIDTGSSDNASEHDRREALMLDLQNVELQLTSSRKKTRKKK